MDKIAKRENKLLKIKLTGYSKVVNLNHFGDFNASKYWTFWLTCNEKGHDSRVQNGSITENSRKRVKSTEKMNINVRTFFGRSKNLKILVAAFPFRSWESFLNPSSRDRKHQSALWEYFVWWQKIKDSCEFYSVLLKSKRIKVSHRNKFYCG